VLSVSLSVAVGVFAIKVSSYGIWLALASTFIQKSLVEGKNVVDERGRGEKFGLAM